MHEAEICDIWWYVSLHDHSHSVEAHPLVQAWPNPACKHNSIYMLWCQHKYAHSTCQSHMHSDAHTFLHSQSSRPSVHTETNTYYTHTVNLTPSSNAERIVPGLGDIKSWDYPIKSYSTPSPTHAISVEQTIAPHHEGRGKCAYVNVCVHALFGTWIQLQCWINVIILVFWFFFGHQNTGGQLSTNVPTNRNIKLITVHSMTTDNAVCVCVCVCVCGVCVQRHTKTLFSYLSSSHTLTHTHPSPFNLPLEHSIHTISDVHFPECTRKENYFYPYSTIWHHFSLFLSPILDSPLSTLNFIIPPSTPCLMTRASLTFFYFFFKTFSIRSLISLSALSFTFSPPLL